MSRRPGPPRILQWLCATTLPYRHREIVLGDLFEQYTARVAWSGRRAARRWYVGEVLRGLWPTLRAVPAYLLSPNRYGLQDAMAIGWAAAIGVILVSFLVASGML